MKVAYKHLISYIPSKPSIKEISDIFFQLGHEHEIENQTFNMELTPNRGDCFSVHGLVRELAPFYNIELYDDIYEGSFKHLDIDFINKAPEACCQISFLKIEIEGEIAPYKGKLKEYFENLELNKNNLFTDISNYVSYERGQPTHCYDAKKISGSLSLEVINENKNINTLLDKEIALKGSNLVFLLDGKVINLAGVIGDKDTSCSISTNSVVIECAHFNAEEIIGKSLKYDIKSEAAHKFERGVDPQCHEETLRRFIQIVSDHVNVKNVELYSNSARDYVPITIPFDANNISNIIGIPSEKKAFEEYLLKLGFIIQANLVTVPSYRNDIKNLNDIAEEIARVIGYNNIQSKSFNLNPVTSNIEAKIIEKNIKYFLKENGFFEVINNPFVNKQEENSIKVDNPLDLNRQYIRTTLKNSLVENLIYNERRQQDSIKLFEISDTYRFDKNLKKQKTLGIICSGRVGKNFQDFSKNINIKYLKNLMNELFSNINPNLINIDRKNINTKLKSEIVYMEISLDLLKPYDLGNLKHKKQIETNKFSFNKYKPISEFPSSSRDLSISIKDLRKYEEIQDYLLNYQSNLIKEIFIFDYYNNIAKQEVKLGFRFIFQSKDKTITENEINAVMSDIFRYINDADGIYIPGLELHS